MTRPTDLWPGWTWTPAVGKEGGEWKYEEPAGPQGLGPAAAAIGAGPAAAAIGAAGPQGGPAAAAIGADEGGPADRWVVQEVEGCQVCESCRGRCDNDAGG